MALNKRKRLIDYLKTTISCGNYRPGDRLPTIRVLAEQFKLTVSTAYNALRELQKEGLIEFRHGDGIYVCNGHPPKLKNAVLPERRITVIAGEAISIDPNHNYSAYALKGLQDEASRHRFRIELRFWNYCRDGMLKITPEEITDSDVLVFLGTYDWSGMEYPAGTPAVGLSVFDSNDPYFSSVVIDPFSAAKLACRFFEERNIRHVRLISTSFGMGRSFKVCFADAFEPYGTVDVISADTDCIEPEFFADPDAGYLFTGGTACQMTSSNYRKLHGRSLIEERTVLSLDGKSRYIGSYEPVCNIGVDWELAGEMLLGECLYRLENPGQAGRRICLIPNLQETS